MSALAPELSLGFGGIWGAPAPPFYAASRPCRDGMLVLLTRLNAAEVVLQPVEWKALYCRGHHTTNPPDTVLSLGWARSGSPASAVT